MKNTSLFRRVLSVVLVLTMLGSLLVPMASAAPAKEEAKTRELTLTPIELGESDSRGQEKMPVESMPETEHAATDLVRVSIVLDKASTLDAGYSMDGIANNTAAKNYRASLRADQAAMTAKIEQAIGGKLDVKWNLTLAANIISANVLYGKIDAIKAIPGVKDVFLENFYEPQVAAKSDEPNNGSASYMIGSNITWAAGYTGAGSKVAVIDTGIDLDHKSFSGEALEYALAQNAEEKGMSYDEYVASLNLLTPESIDAVKDQLNAPIGSGAAAYRNTKVGFGYNYVDQRIDYITHMQDSQGEHGSHVEGISAANRFVKEGDEFKPALEAVGTQGVAPDAQIVTMKVFGINGGAADSDYMAAIEDAIVLGCDSANLSLGSGAAGFGFSQGYEEVLNKLVKNGMVCSISMGNSYGWYDTPYDQNMYPYLYADDASYHTGGSPGSFTNSLAVASVDNLGQTGFPLLFGDRHVFYSQTSGYGNDPISSIAGQEYEYVLVDGPGVDDNANVGKEGDQFLALGREVLEGKVAMCYRGSSSFFAKANAAAAQGAIAIIIINNVDGVINMNLTDYAYHAPAVSILKADGDAIKADSEKVTVEGGEYYTGTMSVSKDLEVQVPELTDTVTVSSFSSWGVPGTLVLKPEILTPGGSIYSVWGANNGSSSPTQSHEDYEVMSGTSMAAPQVNGMAGVLGQYIRDNDLCEKTGLTQRQLINSLLMSTAHPVYDADGSYWPVIRVGAGLGNVGDAVAAKSYILMGEDSTIFPDSAKDGKVKAELGDDPERTGVYDYSFTVYPLDGTKEFTLRSDLFTQDIAGNAGYGLLQYTGTTLLDQLVKDAFDAAYPAYEISYEVNGQTYEDSFKVEADVNKDGVTDRLDAQAILDYLTGKNDGKELDLDAADVDGDENVTSYDAKLILESAATPTIAVSEPTEVKVHIELSDYAKTVFNYYYTGGAYIQGYTYVDPVADEEGNMDVVHSIPVLAYYGNWTDASMFDRSSAIDAAYGTGKKPYLSNSNTNYLSLKDADGDTSVYMGNPYMVEDKFPADKLAMNSESTIVSFNYLPIRNVATLGFAILDEEGNVLAVQATPTQRYGAYYYVNGGSWQQTSPSNYNVGRKLASAGVKEGDKVTVAFFALPEYYAIQAAKLNGEVATSGSLDTAGLKQVLEAGLIGDGAAIQYTVTVDDTAPEVKGALQDLITGDIYVKASDNEYIAYVAITNKSGNTVYFETVPEQTEPGQEIEVPLELEGVDLPKDVVLLVGDYAGNEVAFKVNLGGNGGEAESYAGQMFGFVPAGSTYGPGSGNRVWTIDPATASVTTSSYTGVENFANVNFTVTAAEYVDGYVFMAADDGWFYASALEEMNEASRAGKYSDTVEKIYDMAFNYKNDTMYVLGNDNTIYAMDDLTNCNLIPVCVLTLPGATGTAAEANRLAIDDNGVFYIGNYGTYSVKANLYKFELPEEEEPETPSELGDLVNTWGFETADEFNTWTIVDANSDGKTWSRYTSSGSNDSTACISNTYNSSKFADDWAISPAVDLTGGDTATLSFWAKNYGYLEKLNVYAGTSADPAEMTKVLDTFEVPNDDWMQFTADLSAFAGEAEVYVAIHHVSDPDMFRVFVDDVAIYTQKEETEEPGEPEPVVVPEVEPELVGSMGVSYNYSKGGAFAWDHNEGILYLVTNYNDTNDSDHHLWTVDTTTGKATKTNSNSNLRASVRGLFIVPGRVPSVHPTDEATNIIVEPEVMELLKGQSAELKVAVLPWTLTDKDVTFESADPTIASVKDGVVTAVNVGETTITVTTVAEPHLTAEVKVIVTLPPEAELRGIVWDEDGKGQASVFKTNATADWEALSVVGQLRWGALVGDTVYGSTDDTMYAFDADTYEVTTLGGIVSMWIPSDAAELPQDYIDAFADMGYNVGPVLGPNNNGTYLTMLDPEAGSLIYFDFTDTFGSDPMALITYHHREDYEYIDWNTFSMVTDPDCAVYYMMTESGALYSLLLTHDGSAVPTKIADTGLDLTGVADATNSVWGSMTYNEENDFLYISLYNGADDYAHLYAIDASDPTRMSCTGDFRENVWPVTGLYEYEPLTDLYMKVEPTELELFETQTAEINVKIKMGETNEYTAEIADPTICSFEDGVVTGLKDGETDITITTVDTNEAGEHLTETVHVTVKGLLALDLTVKGQVTDAKGARFTTILLDGPTAASRGKEAPFDVKSGALVGDLYLAATDTEIVALDPETFEAAETDYNPDPAGYFAQYPAQDIANYPYFVNADGDYDTSKALFTTNLGWVVKPDFYGWNLSSYLPDMAAIAFCGTDTNDEGANLYVYYILTTAGVLYEFDINYATGSYDGLYRLLDTGITCTDQSALSMTFVADATISYTEGQEMTYGLVIANNEDKTLWFVDFQTGEVGMVGTLEADNVSGLIGYYDELVAVDEEPDPQPIAVGDTLVKFDFEEDPTDWIFYDDDEDGYTWAWNHNISSWYAADAQPDYDTMAYEGTGCLMTGSYLNTVGELTPDNWAYSPVIDLTEVEGEAILTFWAKSIDSNYPENFAVYVQVSGAETPVKVMDDTTTKADYTQYSIDLSDYVGNKISIGFRNYNVTDMFLMALDSVEVLTNVEWVMPENVADPYQAPEIASVMSAKLGDGFAIASAVPAAEIEMTRFGESTNAVVGGTNAVKGQIVEVRKLDDETINEEGTVKVVLSEDEAVTNGLIEISYDPEILTFVDASSELQLSSINEAEGVICFAYASVEEIAAETALATLNFSYSTEASVNTEITVKTLERNDNVAVKEDALVIPVVYEKVEHEHVYGEPVWTWNEDLTEAKATFTCEAGDDTQEVVAEITSEVTAEPTEQAEGVETITAKVTFQDKEYTDVKTRPIAKLEHDCPCKDFSDMPEYGTVEHAAIDWAFTHEPQITNGTGDGMFHPERTLMRSEAVTFLWRAAGCPEPTSSENPFTDVPNDTWFTEAVLWAVEKGITNGTGDGTTFSPTMTLDTGMMLTFLYRQQGKPPVENQHSFSDVPSYYAEGVSWAVENKIAAPKSETEFGSAEPSTRADTVVYLYRVYTGNMLAE